MNKINCIENLMIYGAGVEGKKTYNILKEKEIEVKGFIITDGHKKESEYIENIPVRFISEIEKEKEKVNILIAANPIIKQEMWIELYNRGFKEIYLNIESLIKTIENSNENYVFENRSKGNRKMCMVLAGYKEFLWDDVFKRLKLFQEDEIDICILSSGIYNKNISEICAKNNWSYLSTNKNSVTLIQNLAIILHPQADMIFKLDEDIFITKNYFSSMLNTYKNFERENCIDIAFVAPLIPVNGYGHVRVLEKLGLKEIYEEKFGKLKYTANPIYSIEKNPDAAKFFWGKGNFVKSIDEISNKFYNQPNKYSICPIRFSIGAILFTREFWNKIGRFSQPLEGCALGIDEQDLCCGAIWNSAAIVIDENILVGHLSFGQQNANMKEYYLNNPEKFKIKGL